MKRLCLTAAAAAALVLAATSQAGTTPHHGWYSMTLPERRAVVVREIRHQRAPIRRWLSSRWEPNRWLEDATPFRFCLALGTTAPGPICAHGQKLDHALVVLRRVDANLARSRATTAPAHLAGWSCITNGAYPGAAHEGDGYNGSYSGPLGMTTPWLGHYPTGSDWVHSSRASVYAIAEAEAAKRGFSYAFMAGQWPETFPPCASYFR